MKRFLARVIPDALKPTPRAIANLPGELLAWWKGPDHMIPPRSMVFVGGGDYVALGEEFKRYFIELGGLQPDQRVLDVGCGCGRMAVPLTGYLDGDGGYWGFDIVAKGIRWCTTRIAPKFPRFHFHHADVYNKQYNRRGSVSASAYRFPYEDGFFDFVFLTSVFTHMLPEDVENYLSEIARVLKPGGTCLLTFFLLNPESEALVREGRTSLDFRHERDGCRIISRRDPEAAIAYTEERVRAMLADRGLVTRDPIQYGHWCERDRFLSYQDILVADKPARDTED